MTCIFGFHKYSSREVHITKRLDDKISMAAIAQKCDRCGDKKITGEELQTIIIIPQSLNVGEG